LTTTAAPALTPLASSRAHPPAHPPVYPPALPPRRAPGRRLGLAHVYESPELEHNCLKFMQANAAAVVQRQEFAGLAPEALVKYNMFCAGIEPAEAAGRKRKRGD
jgi:hypothetical protein